MEFAIEIEHEWSTNSKKFYKRAYILSMYLTAFYIEFKKICNEK